MITPFLKQAATVFTLIALAVVPAAAGVPTGMSVADGPGAKYFGRGIEVMQHGQGRLGLEYMAAGVTLAPDNMARHTYLAAFLNLPEYRSDVTLFERLHAVMPNYAPVMERLGMLYDGKQRHAEAESVYLAWAAAHPDSSGARARLAEHYVLTGEYRNALKAFEAHRDMVGESEYALRRMIEVNREMGHNWKANRLAKRLRALQGKTEHAKVVAMQ